MTNNMELEVGEQLRVLQTRHGYSNEALARMAGVSINTLKAIFKTDTSVQFSKYVAVAKVFDKQIKYTLK